MDPVCHTLVGWSLAQGGLKRWSARATATLVIAANLPDVDIAALLVGRNLELRRGWTHGLFALALWPWLLAGLVWCWDRWPNRAPVRIGALVALGAIGVVTHPILDYLNNYGLRWLMPFQDRWYYGDTLFIVDPWLLAALGGGLLAARKREQRRQLDPGRPARIGLAAAAIYIGLMMLSTSVARLEVSRSLARTELANARFMATAVPFNPFAKEVIVDDGRRYHRGRFHLVGAPRLALDQVIDKGVDHAPAVDRARQEPAVRAFLHWSRFPVVQPVSGDSLRLRAYDLRYAGPSGLGWASIEFSPGPP